MLKLFLSLKIFVTFKCHITLFIIILNRITLFVTRRDKNYKNTNFDLKIIRKIVNVII